MMRWWNGTYMLLRIVQEANKIAQLVRYFMSTRTTSFEHTTLKVKIDGDKILSNHDYTLLPSTLHRHIGLISYSRSIKSPRRLKRTHSRHQTQSPKTPKGRSNTKNNEQSDSQRGSPMPPSNLIKILSLKRLTRNRRKCRWPIRQQRVLVRKTKHEIAYLGEDEVAVVG